MPRPGTKHKPSQLAKEKGVEKFIIVGAGVGGWIMLHAAQKKPDTVMGLVGVAADPDFTETLVWPALDDATKDKVMAEGIAEISWGESACIMEGEGRRGGENGGERRRIENEGGGGGQREMGGGGRMG